VGHQWLLSRAERRGSLESAQFAKTPFRASLAVWSMCRQASSYRRADMEQPMSTPLELILHPVSPPYSLGNWRRRICGGASMTSHSDIRGLRRLPDAEPT